MNLFFSATIERGPALMLMALAVTCAFTDLWRGKVYNVVTYAFILAAFAMHQATHPGLVGLRLCATGLAAGFFPPFVAYLFGGMGGGDVKLMAAVGAIAGVGASIEALLCACVIGTFLALCMLAWRGQLFATLLAPLRRVLRPILPARFVGGDPPQALKLRFALAICGGILLTLWDLRTGAVWSLMS